MTTVAVLRAIIGLDTTEFDSGVRKVESGSSSASGSMRKLGEALAGTGSGADSVSSALDKASEAADGVGDAAGSAAGEVSKLGNAADAAADDVKELGGESDRAEEKIEKTGKAAKETAGKTRNLGDESGKAAKKVKELAGNLQTVAGFVQSVGAGLTAGLTLPIVAVAAASVDAATDFDSLKRGLQAVSQSSEETEYQLRRLREVAKLPGLGLEDAIKGATALEAAGFSASLAERSLKAFGNALATVGKGKADLDGVNLALTQLANRTSGFGQELRQLQERLPQIRQVLLRVFNTSDTEEIAKLGVTGKQVVELLVREFEKLPGVMGGARNSFENFQDSMRVALASLGEDLLPVVTPALDFLGKTAEYVARIFGQLPVPFRAVIIGFTGILAAAGPIVLILGTLGVALANVSQAWQAFIALKGAITAAVATENAIVITCTGSIIGNAVALNTWSAAAKLALPLLAALTAGWTIGTMINDAFIGSIDRQAQATEDATKAMRTAIPFLDETIRAREKLANLEKIISQTGNTGYRESPRYKEVQRQVDELRKQYEEAAELMKKGFDRATAESIVSVEKMRNKFAEAVMDAQKELDKLKAPTLEAKLKVDYPKIDDAEIKRLAAIEREVEATKKLQEARKKAAEEHARSVKGFLDQIKEAQQEIAALRAPNTTARIRALNPGMPENQVRQLAGLKDEITALEKIKDKREEEKKKIEELSRTLSKLGISAGDAAVSIKKAGMEAAKVGTVVPGSPSVPTVAPPGRVTPPPARVPGKAPVTYDKNNWPVWNAPPLPDLSGGYSAAYSKQLKTLPPILHEVAAAQNEVKSSSVSLAQQLAKDIGVEQAQKLIESTKSLRAEYAQLGAVTERERVALEVTGKSYAQLTNATQQLVNENLRLRQSIKGMQELKTLGEAWNSARLEMLKSRVTTEEQKIALDVLKKSFETLSPEMQGRIREMAQWSREQEAAKKATAEAAKFNEELGNSFAEARQRMLDASAGSSQQRILLQLLHEQLKTVPSTVRTAAEALDYLRNTLGGVYFVAEGLSFTLDDLNRSLENGAAAKRFSESIETATGDARLKFLELKSATEEERIALGFFKDRINDLPSFITNAGDALSWFERILGLNVEEAKRAAAAIAKFNAETTKPASSAPQWIKDFIKLGEDAQKAVKDLEGDTTRRLESARRRMSGMTRLDPANAAWLDYLAQNKALANAIAFGMIKAADARKKFIEAFEAERAADTMEKLRDLQRDANRELEDAKHGTSEYNRVLQELGLTAGQVDRNVDAVVKDVVKLRLEARKINQLKEMFKEIANELKSVFTNAFEDLFEHGFKSFFDSVIQGFQQMLARMAAEFLASQLMKLVTNLIGNVIGSMGGGGGTGSTYKGDVTGDFGGYAADGGPVMAGKSYLVGEEGPEIFVPSSAGRILSNREVTGSTVIHYNPTYHISTPDANSFRRSQSQIVQDGARTLRAATRRNGDR